MGGWPILCCADLWEEPVSLDVVILAAGKGTRMKSDLPKVLHPLMGKPLVLYSVEMAQAVSERPPVLVVGHAADDVKQTVGEAARYVLQEEQLGTGHAVAQAQEALQGSGDHVIVIYGDMPLLRADSLRSLYQMQQANQAGPITMLTLIADTPRGFGRIVRAEGGSVQAIVEEADATPEQLAISEVNPGVYCFEAAWLWSHLDKIPVSPKGEYYLTDLVGLAVDEGATVNAITIEDPNDALGINTRVHLAEAEAVMRQRINEAHMLAGVTIVDPAATYIHPGVEIGRDTVIQPNTHLWGQTAVGAACVLGPDTTIIDSTIGDRCEIRYSVVEGATVEDACDIGPFGHLRKGAHLESGVHMGNFGEVKNSRLRQGVKMGHFSYLGDADIGEGTNIGAGTITCNYDGVRKHKTVTGKNVFIGSDTMLVAPVTLGDGAATGAGAVVTKDVPPDTVVVGVPARILRRTEKEHPG
jgi:bifunctional UDP-N-acetylglucosamine pyrophosphorylase / glucosamine-1-phosphate N-acetyltransferase